MFCHDCFVLEALRYSKLQVGSEYQAWLVLVQWNWVTYLDRPLFRSLCMVKFKFYVVMCSILQNYIHFEYWTGKSVIRVCLLSRSCLYIDCQRWLLYQLFFQYPVNLYFGAIQFVIHVRWDFILLWIKFVCKI